MSADNERYRRMSIKVKYRGDYVGTLALTADRRVAFSYDMSWIKNGFSISPFHLPLEDKVFVPVKNFNDGLFGIFADSLPDAWGKLLLDRTLCKLGIGRDITVLDRLAYVGKSGMGALEYEPDCRLVDEEELTDLDYICGQCRKVLESEQTDDIDVLYEMTGSSGGARPKVIINDDGREWIVKFPASSDSPDIGRMEYAYSVCAGSCGIDVPEVKLFPSKKGSGYFGIERFDRVKTSTGLCKIHMATAAALLEADYRSPCLDYSQLMKLTQILTGNDAHDMENMFRRACFNVFAHNRDDHAKNFTFLYDDEQERWRLSPAYDLTYSTTYYGEHTTSVNGNGRNPGAEELLRVGVEAGLHRVKCKEIIEDIRERVTTELTEIM